MKNTINRLVYSEPKVAYAPQALAAEIYINFGCISPILQIISELEAAFELFPNGFERHFEKRKDQERLFGRCWSEILNISSYKFKQYFDEIGIRYDSPEELPSTDINACFQGKLYCRVLRLDNHRRTTYYRNHSLIEQLLSSALNSDAGNMGVER